MSSDNKSLKWFNLFPLPRLFVPVQEITRIFPHCLFALKQLVSTWPYETVLYEMQSIHTTPQGFIKWRGVIIWTLLLSLFYYSLEGECVPSAAVHVELPYFFWWHNIILNSIACWASSFEWIQNGLMTRKSPWTLSFHFKMLRGLEEMCVCVFFLGGGHEWISVQFVTWRSIHRHK